MVIPFLYEGQEKKALLIFIIPLFIYSSQSDKSFWRSQFVDYIIMLAILDQRVYDNLSVVNLLMKSMVAPFSALLSGKTIEQTCGGKVLLGVITCTVCSCWGLIG
jgi:hypothetical protein